MHRPRTTLVPTTPAIRTSRPDRSPCPASQLPGWNTRRSGEGFFGAQRSRPPRHGPAMALVRGRRLGFDEVRSVSKTRSPCRGYTWHVARALGHAAAARVPFRSRRMLRTPQPNRRGRSASITTARTIFRCRSSATRAGCSSSTTSTPTRARSTAYAQGSAITSDAGRAREVAKALAGHGVSVIASRRRERPVGRRARRAAQPPHHRHDADAVLGTGPGRPPDAAAPASHRPARHAESTARWV